LNQSFILSIILSISFFKLWGTRICNYYAFVNCKQNWFR